MVKRYEDTNIKAIADAIRTKNGTTNTYKVSEMSQAILAIQGGVIEVTALPTESNVGAVYKVAKPCLVDVVYYNGRYVYRGAPQSERYRYVKTKPTENIAETSANGSVTNPYYVEDENDIFFYMGGVWTPFSDIIGAQFKGTITNPADATESGYYAVLGTEYEYFEYINEVEDVIWVREGTATKISSLIASTAFFTIPTKTTEGVVKSNASDSAFVYYIEDENDVFMYNADWRSLSFNFGTAQGTITDISEATENGYYILRNLWKRLNA